MRALALAAVVVALIAAGCGGNEAATSGGDVGPRVYPGKEGFATITDRGKSKPTVVPPNQPPPREVLSRDLEVGSGPVARRGDRVWVRYFGTNYKTGEEQYPGRWPPLPPLPLELGSSGEGDAWENGIVGMRVGGRRELIVPSHLLYRTGTIDYVVDLVRVKPPREKARGG